MRRLDARRIVLVAALTWLCGDGVGAHEIGTTRVSVTLLADQRYQIDVVTDAATLLEKLEASSGRTQASDTGSVDPQALLASLDEVFRRRVKATFDGRDVRPAIAWSVSKPRDDAPAVATVRLTGAMPHGARTFTWSYAWTFATYALTVRRVGAAPPVTEWLEGGQTSAPVALAEPAPLDRLGAVRRYFTLGFTHIVPKGLDHVLFVLGIFLLSGRARSVLWQVSAFTVAHSLTLGASLYGLIAVSPSLVEPLIALSIAYVAVENMFRSELRPWRVALVFAFGLLHGLGFAGALSELGLARSDFLTALLTFNLGVEAGQLAVIVAAFVLVGWPCGTRTWYRRRIVVPASLLIACTACYWTIERLPF